MNAPVPNPSAAPTPPSPHFSYDNPLIRRYASAAMAQVFSPQFKHQTWRKLWILLAETEKELGLPISDEQLAEMRAHEGDIDFEEAARQEKRVRHDVMAHVHTYGKACPKAAGIIHLGATSAYVADNTDLIQMREALDLIKGRLVQVIRSLSVFAREQAAQPTLGFTHFQPAQPVTVGKRATLWIQELLLDLEELTFFRENLPFLGCKGTTGTQASFLELFDGDHAKVQKLNAEITRKAGFARSLGVSGQTYTRKLDSNCLTVLGHICESLAKFSTDLRLLQHLKEVEEPFEKEQIGSSAMAYKRNPMRSERIGSLARFAQSLCFSTAFTSSTQWFERTLDDSANKRLAVPQAFLAVDAMLILAANVSEGLVVYPKVIEKRLREEMPFMATENIMMAAVKKGGDRQELHERIRVHSQAAAKAVKQDGLANDLLERIAADASFGLDLETLKGLLDPKLYVGRSPEQVAEFLDQEVNPALERHGDVVVGKEEIRV